MQKYVEEMNELNLIRILEIGFENQNFIVQKTISEIVTKFQIEKANEKLIEFVVKNVEK